MKTDFTSNSRSNSLSKINEEVDKLISAEKKKKHLDENHTFLNNLLGDEEDFNYQIPIDIDKKILEMAERRDFDLANSKKNKSKKMGLDLLNEQLDDLIKKTINESKAETGGTDSPSKNSQNKKCKKKLVKHQIDYEENYEGSLENNNNSITSFMNSDPNNNYENNSNINEEESSISGDEKELIEFLSKKTCRNKNLKKYRDEYEKKKKYRNKIIILGSEEDSDEIKENNDKKNIEINEDKKEKKHLKRLKKNTDNKEMKLPLDTECIICTCIIKELANPEGCNHDFCKNCLIEWSQRSSKCPMCKTYYNNIYIYDGGIKKPLSINDIRNNYKKLVLEESDNHQEEADDVDNEENIDEGCYICGKNTDQTNLLVCERCRGNCCHYYCINLNKIPEGKWYCTYCIEEMKEIKMNKKKVEHFFL